MLMLALCLCHIVNQALVIRILTWFSSEMSVDEKQKISHWLLLFVHQQLHIAPLLSVSLEVGCKPPIHSHFRLLKDASFYERDM